MKVKNNLLLIHYDDFFYSFLKYEITDNYKNSILIILFNRKFNCS